jgi:peptidyl-prolyl cis-trans isomerase D
MRAIVKARVRVSEQEAYVDFASQSSKIAVEYVELSRSFYQRHADASADAVAKWTEKNAKEVDDAFAEKKDEFAPECRKARHILVRIDDSASDKEAAKKKAREKLDAAKKRIDGGDDFATVAREVSEDAQSAPRGGELGCFAAGKLAKPNTAKPVDDAAFGLAKGKVSAVVESSFGLHLVKVEDVLKGEAAEKEGKSQIAREKYLRAEGDRLAADAAKQILDTVKGGKTLEAALSDHLASLAVKKDEKGKDKKDAKQPVPDDPDRPKIATSKEFTSAGPPFPGVEDGGGAARMLFALDKPGAVAPDVIKLYDGFAVAALKEKKGVDAKEWEEKRATLLATLRQKRQQDALVAYLHQLRQKHAKSITYITSAEEGDQKKAKDKKKPDKAPAPVPSGS